MNGIHDVGGMQGFGPVEVEAGEPVFHADWEPVVYAAVTAFLNSGYANLDEFRHGIERMDPARYLESSYYERWFASLLRLLDEKGLVTAAALDAALRGTASVGQAPAAAGFAAQPRAGHRFRRDNHQPPRFSVGESVRTRVTHPRGHTRLPRYARGKRGTVGLRHGTMVFPDTHAHGAGEQPQHLYNVRFEAAELWGDSAEGRAAVYLNLWESYLVPA